MNQKHIPRLGVFLLIVGASGLSALLAGCPVGDLTLPRVNEDPAVNAPDDRKIGVGQRQTQNGFGGSYFDDYTVNITLNPDINQGTITNVVWDSFSAYSPAGTGSGEIPIGDPDLVALWHFNGNAFDSSGNNDNGVLNGDTDCSVPGKFDQACSYDGVGDYIEFADPDYIENIPAFSVAAWVRANVPDNPSGSKHIIITKGAGNDLFQLYWSDNENIHFVVYDQTNAKHRAVFSDGILDTDWHHVAGVVDANGVRVYVDGIQGDVTSAWNGNTQIQSNPLTVSYPGSPWDGIIDEAAIWTRPLTLAEIQSLAQAQTISGGFASNLIDVTQDIYSLHVTWIESANGTSAQVSFDDGATWCDIANGEELNDANCPFPVSSFKYSISFNGQTNLDSIRFDYSTTAPPQCGDADGICPAGCSFSLGDVDCTYCGDDVTQSPNDDGVNEICDGSSLAGSTCDAQGYDSGTLACAPNCLGYDTSSCNSICGNGIISTGEQCDDGNLVDDDGCSSTCQGEGSYTDDYVVDIASNPNIDPLTVNNVGWDGTSSYHPLGPGSGEIAPGDPDLVALWHFNGNAFDSSGNNDNGVLNGDTDCSVPGKFDQACSYDGVGDYIEFADPDYIENIPAFSVAAWVRANVPDNPSGSKHIIITKGAGNDLFQLYWSDNENIHFVVYDQTNAKHRAVFSDGILDTDWHHVAGVVDANGVRVYVDGIQGDVTSAWNGNTQIQSNPLTVSYPGSPWDGIIDEAAIWTRPLTLAEIQSLAQAQTISGGFASNLIDVTQDIYSLHVTWIESANGTSAQVSFDDGATWCDIANGEELNDANCPFPVSSFKYSISFNGQTNLDSIRFDYSTTAPPQCGDADGICPAGCSFSLGDVDCTYCGDDVTQSPNDDGVNEICDGSSLAGSTCDAQGYDSGTLACALNCLAYDTSSCSSTCGNGIVSAGEQCDDGNLVNDDGCSSTCQNELVPGATRIQFACGEDHTCALLLDGNVRCFGRNDHGELGDLTTNRSYVPLEVVGIADGASISAGGFHTCVALLDGFVRCWGDDSEGAIGDGPGVSSSAPASVVDLSEVIAISAGGHHNCAVLLDGSVKCWGENNDGELGDGTDDDRFSPVDVIDVTNVTAVGTSHGVTCVVLLDGRLQCWGRNEHGQLGDGTVTSSLVPVAVVGINNAHSVGGGNYHRSTHICAALSDGRAKCWGDNTYGQLGDGTFTSSSVPVTVVGLDNVVDVTVGRYHSCAVLSDGLVKCWGNNCKGALGNGTTNAFLEPETASVPLTVTGIDNAVAVEAGGRHTCAVLSDGSAKCWGDNRFGQLGTIERFRKTSNFPIDVVGL